MLENQESSLERSVGARIYLALSALVWLPYGLLCMVNPWFLEEMAGVAVVNPMGVVELRAMYGGLQMAIGVLSVLGFFTLAWRKHALVALGFVSLGVGFGRFAGAIIGDQLSAFMLSASALELVMGFLALFFARR